MNGIFCFSLLLVYDKVKTQLMECDGTKTPNINEGNIGESKSFRWLGVLRVHSHNDEKLQIGLTGLVLIKQKYGIVNADDVAEIPKHHLIKETQAMFVINDGETFSCGVKDIRLHPEYQYATYNTIALTELEYQESDDFLPICLPDYNFNTKNELYAFGFVDDNKLLEKVIYNIQYVDRDLCDDFYNRAGDYEGYTNKDLRYKMLQFVGFQYKDILYKPTSYYCGFAANNKKNCVWENGMILATNTSGSWIIIGFGIKGPGCSAPIRFLNILSYLYWIETSTDENVYVK